MLCRDCERSARRANAGRGYYHPHLPHRRTGKDPIFYSGRSYQGAKGPVYPYPLLDKLSDTKEDRKYHAILLENPYVQLPSSRSLAVESSAAAT